MAYVTFNSVHNLTAHHRLHHHQVTYQCLKCSKTLPMPNSFRLHQYSHYGGCSKKYKHPQDLAQHVDSHLDVRYECDFCDKIFKEKRLLKCHLVIHQKTTPYKCTNCEKEFRHSNQLYRHRKTCM